MKLISYLLHLYYHFFLVKHVLSSHDAPNIGGTKLNEIWCLPLCVMLMSQYIINTLMTVLQDAWGASMCLFISQ